jgi:hypothetical protein
MDRSIFDGKGILVVGKADQRIEALSRKIKSISPTCHIESAASFADASDLLRSWTYHLMLLNVTDRWGHELLVRATIREPQIPVVVTSLPPELHRASTHLKARLYLYEGAPEVELTFLQDLLTRDAARLPRRFCTKVWGLLKRKAPHLSSGNGSLSETGLRTHESYAIGQCR